MKENNGGVNFKRTPKKKVCPFCVAKIDEVDYVSLIKDMEKNNEKPSDNAGEKKERGERRPRYVAENGKIIPRRTSGVCVKHQRDLAVAIKRARIMGLLAFKGE